MERTLGEHKELSSALTSMIVYLSFIFIGDILSVIFHILLVTLMIRIQNSRILHQLSITVTGQDMWMKQKNHIVCYYEDSVCQFLSYAITYGFLKIQMSGLSSKPLESEPW